MYVIDHSRRVPDPKLVSFSACTYLTHERTNTNYRIAYLSICRTPSCLLAFWFLPTNAGESEWKDACCWFSNSPSVELADKCAFSISNLFICSIIRIPYNQSDGCASSAATASSNYTPSPFSFSTCTELPVQELDRLVPKEEQIVSEPRNVCNTAAAVSAEWDHAYICWIYFLISALLHLFILDLSNLLPFYLFGVFKQYRSVICRLLLHFKLSKVVSS